MKFIHLVLACGIVPHFAKAATSFECTIAELSGGKDIVYQYTQAIDSDGSAIMSYVSKSNSKISFESSCNRLGRVNVTIIDSSTGVAAMNSERNKAEGLSTKVALSKDNSTTRDSEMYRIDCLMK